MTTSSTGLLLLALLLFPALSRGQAPPLMLSSVCDWYLPQPPLMDEHGHALIPTQKQAADIFRAQYGVSLARSAETYARMSAIPLVDESTRETNLDASVAFHWAACEILQHQIKHPGCFADYTAGCDEARAQVHKLSVKDQAVITHQYKEALSHGIYGEALKQK
jgi:hypothetical protein